MRTKSTMPKYNYRCSGCDGEFEIRHPMTEVLGTCILCDDGIVRRIPSLSFSIPRTTSAGSLVNEFIKDTKREVQAEKQRLKEDYHND